MKIAHVVTVGSFTELGSRIRQVRLARSLDQRTLAEQVGLDRTAVSRVEAGDRRLTALEAARIAQALDVTLTDLLTMPAPDVRAARRTLEADATEDERASALADLDLDRALNEAEFLRSVGAIAPADLSWVKTGALNDDRVARLLAVEIRSRLGVGEQPIDSMADVAASLGLWSRTTSAAVAGRSLSPEYGFGVAVIGRHLEPGRRRMTLAHEIGHHVSGDTYGDGGRYQSPAELETRLDVFAAELLLPSAVMERLAERDVARQELVQIAGTYRVSWSVLRSAAAHAGVRLPAGTAQRVPTMRELVTVLGAEPKEDLRGAGLAKQWIIACGQAVDRGQITPLRAQEMTQGVLAASDERELL